METKNDVLEKDKIEDEIQEPGMYKVVMLNDDFSTMEFVIFVLMNVFGKNTDEANTIMMNIHVKQRGIAGIYSKDIALSKMRIANETAKENNFPLKCIVERE